MPSTLAWLCALALAGFAIAVIDHVHATLRHERALEEARRIRQSQPVTDE